MKKYATEIHHALTRFKEAGFVVTAVHNGEEKIRHEWATTGVRTDIAVEQILAYDDSWVCFGKDGKHVAEGYVILGNKPGDLFSYTDWIFAGDTTDNAAEYEFNNLTADVPKQFRAWHAINEMPGIAAHIANAYRAERDQRLGTTPSCNAYRAERDKLDRALRGASLQLVEQGVELAEASDTIAELKTERDNWQAEAEAYRKAYNSILNRIEPTVSRVRDQLAADLRKLWSQS